MAKALFTNDASGTLASAITSTGATSLVLTGGQGALFPAPSGGDYFYATIVDVSNNKEIVKVTANAADTFTMVRAQDNTTARTFATGSKVELRPCAAALTEFAVKAALSDIPGANKLINADWRINQRAYVSAATLAAGVYGHDRWKAGASGGDYSFTQLASSTQITIAANKSVVHVVEDKNVEGGSYVLSWTGTAVARVGLNSATPSGTFAVSPILIAGQTAGTTMSVEFTGANAVGTSAVASNSGTLSNVKLETGSIATAFVSDDYTTLLQKCLWYCEVQTAPATNGWPQASTLVGASINNANGILTYARKRVAPTITFNAAANFGCVQPGVGTANATAISASQIGNMSALLTVSTAGALATGASYLLSSVSATAPQIIFSAEL